MRIFATLLPAATAVFIGAVGVAVADGPSNSGYVAYDFGAGHCVFSVAGIGHGSFPDNRTVTAVTSNHTSDCTTSNPKVAGKIRVRVEAQKESGGSWGAA